MTIIRNFLNGNIYHLYNRGVAKQEIFRSQYDYQRLLDNFAYYLDSESKQRISMISKTKLREILANPPKKPLVSILSYCLMPNHFHLMAKQLQNGGISLFMKNSLNSYSRYFNTKNNRIGPIFQGRFKTVCVEDDEQLMHLSRYIHINPYIANLVSDPRNYRWSSLESYLGQNESRICHYAEILELFDSIGEYQDFIQDYTEYLKQQLLIENLALE